MQLSIFTVLFIVFLVLKLMGVIAWSWWWVTAPLWGGFLIIAAFFAFGVLLIRKHGRLAVRR